MMGIAKLKRVVIIMSVILGLIIIIGTAYTFFEEDTPGGPPKPIIPKNNKCTGVKCLKGGVCDLDTGKCLCTSDRTGPLCNKEKEKCTVADCSNNGKPRAKYSLSPNIKDCKCKCNAGFIGEDCSKSKCPDCLDLSKSKCASKKTCIKKEDTWICIKGHYLHRGGAGGEELDCLPCPEGSTIPDDSYNGTNTLSQCKCLTKDGKVGNKYMNSKTKKCESCIDKWKIKSGTNGKILKKPKDSYGIEITDWILYDKDATNPTGSDKDCKCNNKKHYYNSTTNKNTCVKCFQGAQLSMLNGVEICKCDSPNWQMIFAPPDDNSRGKPVPKCVLNETCNNPRFDPKSKSVHYCANPSYFGKDFKKEDNDLAGANYKEFAHPDTGQVKCSLIETEEEKDARITREKSASDKMSNMVNNYLEQGEKINSVNTMINTSKEHISKNEFDEAIRILNEAKLISLGYKGLKSQHKGDWIPFSFKTSGRTETLSPPLVKWRPVKAKELKKHMVGRIVFSNSDIKYGKIKPGVTLQLISNCGTNRKNKIIKVATVSKSKSNPGVIPEEGDNLDEVPASDISGDDCTFVRIRDMKTEASPMDELTEEVSEIKTILKDIKLKKKKAINDAAIAAQKFITDLNSSLHKVDMKTGCIDTPAGNEIKGFNGESRCLLEQMNGKCETEFAIRNCRKTCGHNVKTCKAPGSEEEVEEEVVDDEEEEEEEEGFVNSWEEF